MFVAHEQVREGVEGVHSKGFGDTVHGASSPNCPSYTLSQPRGPLHLVLLSHIIRHRAAERKNQCLIQLFRGIEGTGGVTPSKIRRVSPDNAQMFINARLSLMTAIAKDIGAAGAIADTHLSSLDGPVA